MHRAVPTHPQQLRNPARIFPIGLDRHRRQCRLHMARLEQHHLETGADEGLA
jgi:hypothetical protein